MLDNSIKFPKREFSEGEIIPENIYQVELVDVSLKEEKKYKNPNETEKRLTFVFGFLEGDLRGRMISRRYIPPYLTISSKGKNVLYQVLEVLLGRALTDEEVANLSADFVNSLIGKQCRIVVKHFQSKEGNLYPKIETFAVATSSFQPLTTEEKQKILSILSKSEEKSSNEDVLSKISF